MTSRSILEMQRSEWPETLLIGTLMGIRIFISTKSAVVEVSTALYNECVESQKVVPTHLPISLTNSCRSTTC
jgi:hypothetical protein